MSLDDEIEGYEGSYLIRYGPRFRPPHAWDDRWEEILAGIAYALERFPRRVGRRRGNSSQYYVFIHRDPPHQSAWLLYTVDDRWVTLDDIKFQDG